MMDASVPGYVRLSHQEPELDIQSMDEWQSSPEGKVFGIVTDLYRAVSNLQRAEQSNSERQFLIAEFENLSVARNRLDSLVYTLSIEDSDAHSF